ncbi:gas vesicle protein, partial [Streptomyces sp. 4F]
VGIEILKVDARIVVASVDTYLRFAEACNRLDLEHDVRSKTVPEMFGSPVAKTIGRAGAKRTARSLTDKVRDILTPEEEAEEAEPRTRARTHAEVRERERLARGRGPERPRGRPAARPRDEDDRPHSRPRRRTDTEDE